MNSVKIIVKSGEGREVNPWNPKGLEINPGLIVNPFAEFEIENSGKRLLKFETEAHIKDAENPDWMIIVQSGYTTLKETDEYAELICNILNEATKK